MREGTADGRQTVAGPLPEPAKRCGTHGGTSGGAPSCFVAAATDIESLERTAWADGTSVPSPPGKNVQYRVYDAGKIIGASDGVDTPYIRAECSQGVIHGHPITKEEYLMRLGAN